jgi:hypothetical protein
VPEPYAEYRRAYWEKNRERKNANLKAWREKNRDHVNALARQRNEKNREQLRAYKKAWRAKQDPEVRQAADKRWNANRSSERRKIWRKNRWEKEIENARNWRAANPEKVKTAGLKWRNANLERARDQGRRSDKKRWPSRRAERRTNPVLKLCYRMRFRIYEALKRQRCRKSNRTLKLIGCDWQWLMAWLEVQFQPGMTWENYGSIWHVDHIRPCASFDLSKPDKQRLCFHWSNLQPLFAQENLRKGANWQSA